MENEFSKLTALKNLLPKETQEQEEKGFYCEFFDNGLIKFFAFYHNGKKLWDFRLNENGTGGSYSSRNYAESWINNRIHMLTPWNDNSDDSVESESLYAWAEGILKSVIKNALKIVKDEK